MQSLWIVIVYYVIASTCIRASQIVVPVDHVKKTAKQEKQIYDVEAQDGTITFDLAKLPIIHYFDSMQHYLHNEKELKFSAKTDDSHHKQTTNSKSFTLRDNQRLEFKASHFKELIRIGQLYKQNKSITFMPALLSSVIHLADYLQCEDSFMISLFQEAFKKQLPLDISTHRIIERYNKNLYDMICGACYFASIKTLSLANMKMTNLSFLKAYNAEHYKDLETLNLSDNNFSHINKNMIDTIINQYPCLTCLDLSGNKIDCITQDAFECLSSQSPFKLFLRNNPVRKVSRKLGISCKKASLDIFGQHPFSLKVLQRFASVFAENIVLDPQQFFQEKNTCIVHECAETISNKKLQEIHVCTNCHAFICKKCVKLYMVSKGISVLGFLPPDEEDLACPGCRIQLKKPFNYLDKLISSQGFSK